MPSALMEDPVPIRTKKMEDDSTESVKKRKKSKDGKHEERKSKKARTDSGDVKEQEVEAEEALTEKKKEKREKKEKKEKKDKKDKKEKKEKKDKKRDKETASVEQKETAHDAQDADIQFPFFTQTISLWVPLYPAGFDRPISSVADQHLAGYVNQYSSHLGGYLLAYRNVNLADQAIRADPNHPPDDTTPAVLSCINEYAVGFGWMTVDVDLFVPSRGAWLEGSVIIQNDGAIGVNCWEKFNASIEATRLPRGWSYVDAGSPEPEPEPVPGSSATTSKDAETDGDAMTDGEDGHDGEAGEGEAGEDKTEENKAEGAEDGQGTQPAPVHSTGYWVDEQGQRVQGKIRFRIKDFDVGMAGDHGFLAIEGTMLDPEQECRLMLSERAKRRTGRLGGRKRQLPEFSITQFGKEEEEEEGSMQPVEVYKGSRAGSLDA